MLSAGDDEVVLRDDGACRRVTVVAEDFVASLSFKKNWSTIKLRGKKVVENRGPRSRILEKNEPAAGVAFIPKDAKKRGAQYERCVV